MDAGGYHGPHSSQHLSSLATIWANESYREQIIERFWLELPPRELERYLSDNIDFSLDEENLAGLRRYYEECARAGLIPRAREVEFVNGLSVAR